MLRRTQPIALQSENQASSQDAAMSEAAPPPSFAERRQGDRRQAERRQGERRGMESLRAEALQSLISRVEDRNFGGLRNQVHWSRGIKAPRLALLLLAIIAGGTAAYLATQRDSVVTPAVAQPPAEVIVEPRAQVLVAREGIRVGQRLTVASLGWEDWPEGAVRPEYITIDAAPEAITDMSGSLARVEIFPGEPIYSKKLVPPGQGGHLSAVLDRGKRGVSVSVAAASASGGFIVPGDRVDVVLTRTSQTGSQYSETVLSNVRVLAINTRLGADVQSEEPADIEVFTNSAIATLELDPTQAKVIMTATTMGGLSLVLRPTTDSAETDLIEHRPANQAIRISSPFWAK